jgi:hypothetical protein
MTNALTEELVIWSIFGLALIELGGVLYLSH